MCKNTLQLGRSGDMLLLGNLKAKRLLPDDSKVVIHTVATILQVSTSDVCSWGLAWASAELTGLAVLAL